MQFPKLHFGPGSFDLERSKVKYFLQTLPTMTSDMPKKNFFCMSEVTVSKLELEIAFLSAGLFSSFKHSLMVYNYLKKNGLETLLLLHDVAHIY